jgi:hypothetical protein
MIAHELSKVLITMRKDQHVEENLHNIGQHVICGLSVAYMIQVQNSQDKNSKRCYKIVTSEMCSLLQKSTV